MKKNTTRKISPISIGGIGGSGTRVLSDLLISMDIDMGRFLSKAYDDLWLSILLKSPNLIKYNNIDEIKERIKLYKKLRVNPKNLNFMEEAKILRLSIKKINTLPYEKLFSKKILWPLKRITERKNINKKKEKMWGWKEPNTYIFLEYFKNQFPNLKYIHLIRNGLDMAFSLNRDQLKMWGFLYGIDISQEKAINPSDLLEYWIKANKEAIGRGNKLLGENNFMSIKFKDLCINPENTIKCISKFVGKSINNNKIKKLLKIPKMPESLGRYQKKDLSIFTNSQIEQVRELGFKIG